MEYHEEKTKDEIRKISSKFIERESNRNSMITVTDVYLSKDLKKSVIFVTVFPDKEEEVAINFLKRQRKDLRDFVRKSSKIGKVPFFDFAIDKGEKRRQRIEELLQQT
jgi:ribosome-binding factor A